MPPFTPSYIGEERYINQVELIDRQENVSMVLKIIIIDAKLSPSVWADLRSHQGNITIINQLITIIFSCPKTFKVTVLITISVVDLGAITPYWQP